MTSSVQSFGNSDTAVYTNTSGVTQSVILGLLFGDFVVWNKHNSDSTISQINYLNSQTTPSVGIGLVATESIHMICPNGYGIVGVVVQ